MAPKKKAKAGSKTKAVKKKAGKKTKAKAKTKAPKARAGKVTPIPEGYSTITASLKQNGARATIEFCQKAFGAKIKSLIEGPNSSVMHSQVKIGDSLIHVAEAMQGPAMASSLMLYVKDVDKALAAAQAAGGTVVMPAEDMFWGDRYACVADPQGNIWELASRKELVTNAELKKRSKAFMQQMGGGD